MGKNNNRNRHSIYPVCDETTDNVIGILKAKDFYGTKDKTHENIVKNVIRPAYFVPETVRTDVLFRNMKKTRNHFAIVLDDYGGMSGIITMNDLLEELVGDLEDDDTIPEKPPLIEPMNSHTWKIRSGSVGNGFGTIGCNATGGRLRYLRGLYSAFRVHPRGWKHPELEDSGFQSK